MKIQTPFYVIHYETNSRKFEKYDIMPYLVRCYKEAKKKKHIDCPSTFEEFKKFVERNSKYMYWARCEYEVILSDWPCNSVQTKIDIHWQIMNNLDLVTRLLMENVGAQKN